LTAIWRLSRDLQSCPNPCGNAHGPAIVAPIPRRLWRPSPTTCSHPAPSVERYPAMTKLLFIQTSPRGEQSKSTQVAQAYLDALKAKNATFDVDVLNLWETDLPGFDGDKVDAKINVMTGQEQSAVQKTAWDQIVDIASRFIAADRYLIAAPMWNGSIPYRLKHYIDIIHQPGLLWGLDPETGYFGLLQNKQATLVLTAGAYADDRPSPAFGVDHQSTYLNAWLNQAGVTAIDEVRVQPTLLTTDAQDVLERAKQKAADLAARHASLAFLEGARG
jgi:FMN-dependent NADH-azoreductase